MEKEPTIKQIKNMSIKDFTELKLKVFQIKGYNQ